MSIFRKIKIHSKAFRAVKKGERLKEFLQKEADKLMKNAPEGFPYQPEVDDEGRVAWKVKEGEESATIPFAVKEEIFLRKHPEFENVTPILLGTYRTCQAEKLKGRMRVDVEEAYHHIFEEGCRQCQRRFKSLAKSQEEFFK